MQVSAASGPVLPAAPAAAAPAAAAAGTPAAGTGPLPSPLPPQEAAQRAVAELRSAASALEFSVDAASGETVITVTDPQTHTVLRQIPTPEVLDVRRGIERMQGILLRLKA